MINFASMAGDAQVPASTVREYYEILKDTFIAHVVPAFTETRKRKAISTSKYYLLVSMEPMAREMDGIRILPWTDFLDALWRGEWIAIASASQ